MPHSGLVDVTQTAPTAQTPSLSTLETPNRTSLSPSGAQPKQQPQAATPSSPPVPPPRSALRPAARSISSPQPPTSLAAGSSRSSRAASLETPPPSVLEDHIIIVDPSNPRHSYRMHERDSYVSINELLDAVSGAVAFHGKDPDSNFSKSSVASRPDSALSLGLGSEPSRSESSSRTSSASIPSQSSSSTGSSQSSMTKRQHALHELLSSERAYASDLSLISDIYIPSALGKFPVSLGAQD